MIKKLNSLKFKKTAALCLALICSVSAGSFCVNAASGKGNGTKKTATAANMISGMLEYIKNSNETNLGSPASTTYDTSIKVYFHKENIIKIKKKIDFSVCVEKYCLFLSIRKCNLAKYIQIR